MSIPEKISVIGLGKLGCTMLACFASKGWQVFGVDINGEVVREINDGNSPIFEPGVDELIKENHSKISATMKTEDAVINSSVSFIIVPTPSLDDGSFTTKYVEAAAAEIGSILRNKDDYHLVVITSTVLPGDTQTIINLLEKTSGKRCNKGFGVCYNPDFIALGNIIQDFLNPDMILIGESDRKAGSIVEKIHNKLVNNSPKIHRMNLQNAELAKIALNAYCTLKITFANTLAEICEMMPGGDVNKVTNAIGDDSRIGRKYLKGGLSFGGPCFPRDNRALIFSANRFNVTNLLSKKTDEINNYQKNERIPAKILEIVKEKKVDEIAILGLTYKNNSTLVEESAAVAVIKTLLSFNIKISVFDPSGKEEAKKELDNENITYADSIEDCLKNKKVCFISTPWDEFKQLPANFFLAVMDDPTIFDAWNLYSFDGKIDYRVIGKYKD